MTPDDVRAYPHQIADALWRIEAAGIPQRSLAGGVAVCGVSHGAAELAAEILGDRAQAPVREGLDSPPTDHTFVLVASYSGDDEEGLSCFDAAGEIGAPRAVVCTAGQLAARARDQNVPVIGVPAGIEDPRAAVVYFVLAALEAAARSSAAPSLQGEIEAAAPTLTDLADEQAIDLDEEGRTPSERVLGRLLLRDLGAALSGG
jgi:glucose/mannose-6-phosphate isomerase